MQLETGLWIGIAVVIILIYILAPSILFSIIFLMVIAAAAILTLIGSAFMVPLAVLGAGERDVISEQNTISLIKDLLANVNGSAEYDKEVDKAIKSSHRKEFLEHANRAIKIADSEKIDDPMRTVTIVKIKNLLNLIQHRH